MYDRIKQYVLPASYLQSALEPDNCTFRACGNNLESAAIICRFETLTIVKANFTVLLDVEVDDEEHRWDVAVWHNCTAGQEWTALNLSAHTDPPKMVYIQGQ